MAAMCFKPCSGGGLVLVKTSLSYGQGNTSPYSGDLAGLD